MSPGSAGASASRAGGASLEVEARDAAATRAIGEAFGRTAPEGAVVLLAGPLGAGKTTFAQGVGRGCGVTGPITSPTYNLILHYPGERHFTHVDLYRLDTPAELETLDLDEILSGDGVTCVEWPEKLGERVWVPPPSAEVVIEPKPDGARTLRVRLIGEGWEAARRRLAAAER
ncbi:MAG: tRNA (adenosine(37)-N6)-threonylcarbamoyltransferase complex ATPase subunit type 1 TsaE [Gemmatimonadetes bacterium]|nr:tRNA (adenosine(37)-N6)-threonylcarbamoyltransferase complex ATPase subunit type 1 TsaE [Gemmatimonadota bacterium]